MPCMCWYPPSDENQKRFKEACQLVVEEIKKANKYGDPIGISVEDAKNLIEHLYTGKCSEKAIIEEWGTSTGIRCIGKDGIKKMEAGKVYDRNWNEK